MFCLPFFFPLFSQFLLVLFLALFSFSSRSPCFILLSLFLPFFSILFVYYGFFLVIFFIPVYFAKADVFYCSSFFFSFLTFSVFFLFFPMVCFFLLFSFSLEHMVILFHHILLSSFFFSLFFSLLFLLLFSFFSLFQVGCGHLGYGDG